MSKTENISDIRDLADPADRIANSNARWLRVIAGPGTGKSRALKKHLKHLLKAGVDPRSIIVCTFTRAAASDLRTEIEELPTKGAQSVWAGTVHQLCLKLLADMGCLPDLGRSTRILADYEERFLLTDLGNELEKPIYWGSQKLRQFSAMWAMEHDERPTPPKTDEDDEFEKSLNLWLRRHDAMLRGELVRLTVETLRRNPLLPTQRIERVLVDEYQDLNSIEQQLIELVASNGGLTVIGDEDQSIYSFRYAHPTGITTFSERFPDAQDESLTICRRSPEIIVDLANSLIRRNRSWSQRTLEPRPDAVDGRVQVLQWDSMQSEAEGLASLIAAEISHGNVGPDRILVLAPRREIGTLIRDELIDRGVDAHSFFSEDALEGVPTRLDDSCAQQAFTLLNLLVEPYDTVALRCWLGFGGAKLRANGWEKILSAAEQCKQHPMDLLERIVSGQSKLRISKQIIRRYTELRLRLSELSALTGTDLLHRIFPPTESWSDPLLSMASQFVDTDMQPDDLLDALRTAIMQPELPEAGHSDVVKIMSLHKSKGLSGELVIIPGLVQGLIPAPFGKKETVLSRLQYEEEQRRLFFVAITRAKKHLILSSFIKAPYAMARKWHLKQDSSERLLSSKFIKELGRSCPDTVIGSQGV